MDKRRIVNDQNFENGTERLNYILLELKQLVVGKMRDEFK